VTRKLVLASYRTSILNPILRMYRLMAGNPNFGTADVILITSNFQVLELSTLVEDIRNATQKNTYNLLVFQERSKGNIAPIAES
jgi:hypothetical protein